MKEFKNRVFGSVILKSVNSNFNADFTTHPRTLPNGVVYATDKAIKYAIKDYVKNNYKDEKVFYTKRMNEGILPLNLDETYESIFGKFPSDKEKNNIRIKVLGNLLKCIDIKLFGATFAGKNCNLSIHGPVQINHGVNKYPENNIYTEDILSPFRNKENDENSTIGNQTNLEEGHYVYHFSINPFNIETLLQLSNKGNEANEILSDSDIDVLKDAMKKAVTLLDSSRKIGTENEALIWIQLKEDSKKVFPSLTDLITVEPQNDQRIIDLTKVISYLNSVKDEIQTVEIYFNSMNCILKGFEDIKIKNESVEVPLIKLYDIITDKEIKNEQYSSNLN